MFTLLKLNQEINRQSTTVLMINRFTNATSERRYSLFIVHSHSSLNLFGFWSVGA